MQLIMSSIASIAVTVPVSPIAQGQSPAGQADPTQNSASSSTSTATSGKPDSDSQSRAGGRVSVGGGGSSSSSDSELVTIIKEQVAVQVGLTGAAEVVDNKGNIDYTKLYQLETQQEQAQQAQNQQNQAPVPPPSLDGTYRAAAIDIKA